MTETYVMSVTSQCLFLILLLAAPALMSALMVGLGVSILQATTQVQEQTLSFVPKIVATFMALIVTGSWIANMVGAYAIKIFNDISRFAPR